MSRSPIVIIPTYNERDNVDRLLNHIFLLPPAFEVLIIDDHSPDGTAEIIKAHGEFGRRLHLIERSGKLGLGTAYTQGFTWALERNYPFVLQMDADFSHNPSDLPRLLESAKGCDLALGSRYIPGGGVSGWAKKRETLSRLANIYARIVTRVPAHDLTGGFKCYRRETLLAIDLGRIHSEGYAFQIETTFRVHRMKLRISEVPIIFKEREWGVSKISRAVVWEALWLVAKLGRESFSLP
jgi:dolichol-phosphate mannosyltransferase